MTEKWTDISTPYIKPQAPGAHDAWTQETSGRGSQQLLSVEETNPPHPVRTALQLAAGESAIVRRRLILLDEEPIELTDSYYPSRLATGTSLARKAKIRGGAPTLLGEMGYQPARVIEEVEARGSTESEAARLGIAPMSPVLELQRTSLSASGEPYEVTVMTMKALRRLRYEREVS